MVSGRWLRGRSQRLTLGLGSGRDCDGVLEFLLKLVMLLLLPPPARNEEVAGREKNRHCFYFKFQYLKENVRARMDFTCKYSFFGNYSKLLTQFNVEQLKYREIINIT
jgi:hypothetical protein